MKHSIEAIILGTTRVGDKGLVVHTLSAEFGRRSFIVTVSRSCPTALFLPLGIINAEITENPKSELWRASGITSVFPLKSIRSHMDKNAMTLFLSEVLFRTLRDGAYEAGLYEWCRSSILTLDALESDYASFHLRFLLDFCVALGFRPSVEDMMPFADEMLSPIRSLLTLDMGEAMLLPLSGAERNRIAEILIDYLAYHSETRLEIRSLPVLREIFK